MSESDMEWRMEFTPHERCVGLVRRQVHRTLTRWGCGEDDVDTAVLVCSELATNAVRYAYVPHQNFEVRVGVTARSAWSRSPTSAIRHPEPWRRALTPSTGGAR